MQRVTVWAAPRPKRRLFAGDPAGSRRAEGRWSAAVGNGLGKGLGVPARIRSVTGCRRAALTKGMETVTRSHRRPASKRCAEQLEAYVAATVDAAPPLTSEQAARLRWLLEPSPFDAQASTTGTGAQVGLVARDG